MHDSPRLLLQLLGGPADPGTHNFRCCPALSSSSSLPLLCEPILMLRCGFWYGVAELPHGARHLRVHVSPCTHV